jgi:hypothetical protein
MRRIVVLTAVLMLWVGRPPFVASAPAVVSGYQWVSEVKKVIMALSAQDEGIQQVIRRAAPYDQIAMACDGALANMDGYTDAEMALANQIGEIEWSKNRYTRQREVEMVSDLLLKVLEYHRQEILMTEHIRSLAQAGAPLTEIAASYENDDLLHSWYEVRDAFNLTAIHWNARTIS